MGADDDAQGFDFEGDFGGQLVATAIHAGHGLRPSIAAEMVLAEDARFREEDPFTDRMIARLPARVYVQRSRFEADLNRPPDKAVYRTPEDCWGLEVWRSTTLSPALVSGSMAYYDAFYAALAARLDACASRGPFVVYDVHSYNHRRDGTDAEPSSAEENPVVNVGTGSLDRARFGTVVDAFSHALRSAMGDGDVRENVRFQGGELTAWVHARYPGIGCALALEFKKTFMDEWTGVPDGRALSQIADALAATQPAVLATLGRLA